VPDLVKPSIVIFDIWALWHSDKPAPYLETGIGSHNQPYRSMNTTMVRRWQHDWPPAHSFWTRIRYRS